MEINLLIVPEVALILRSPESRVYKLIRENRLPAVVRVGRQIRIDENKLAEWIENGGQALPGGWKW